MDDDAVSSNDTRKCARSPASEINPSKQLKLSKVETPDDILKELSHLNLVGKVHKKGRLALGGYSDIFIGILRLYVNGKSELEVAIKELRIHLWKEEESFMKVLLLIYRLLSMSNSTSRPSSEKSISGPSFSTKTSYGCMDLPWKRTFLP